MKRMWCDECSSISGVGRRIQYCPCSYSCCVQSRIHLGFLPACCQRGATIAVVVMFRNCCRGDKQIQVRIIGSCYALEIVALCAGAPVLTCSTLEQVLDPVLALR